MPPQRIRVSRGIAALKFRQMLFHDFVSVRGIEAILAEHRYWLFYRPLSDHHLGDAVSEMSLTCLALLFHAVHAEERPIDSHVRQTSTYHSFSCTPKVVIAIESTGCRFCLSAPRLGSYIECRVIYKIRTSVRKAVMQS